jgi:hypothetical protein
MSDSDIEYIPTEISLSALADQLSSVVELAYETNENVKTMAATVANLAAVMQQFGEVNPQELMGLLGSMMGGK